MFLDTQVNRLPFFWGISFVVLLADLLSKTLVSYLGQSMALNQGISFGIEFRYLSIFLGICLLGITVIMSWFVYSERDNVYLLFGKGLFLGGAFANVVDRFMSGGVRDWIPLPGVGVYNNLADIAIFCGVVIWIYQSFIKTETLS